MDAKSGAGKVRYVGMQEAADKVRQADRILVIGCSGGGKSTLSQKIAARFGLDYVSIDRDVLWLPGWVQRPKAEQLERIRMFAGGERWIMDGTNTRAVTSFYGCACHACSASAASSAAGSEPEARRVRKWRPAARKRWMSSFSASYGPGKRSMDRAYWPVSRHMRATPRSSFSNRAAKCGSCSAWPGLDLHRIGD